MDENHGMKTRQPEVFVHPSEFPIYLRARMLQKSVAEFAAELGVTPKLVYLLLSGDRTPSDAILKKLGLEVYYGVARTK